MLCFPVDFLLLFWRFQNRDTAEKPTLQFSFAFHLDSNNIQEYIIVEKYTSLKKRDKKCYLIVIIKLKI